MTFFFDNNLAPQLSAGLKAFGEDVCHLQDCFDDAALDVEWLKYIGEKGMVLVTRDEKIRTRPLELRALKKYHVGAFFLGGKRRTGCQIIQQTVRNWPRMKEYAANTGKPFIFRIPPNGTRFARIPLP